ncbi:urease accessory protein UreE [Salinadaptatus halalkaliphilus]|uniref:Urease accessory protein UreE n=1 Tax=Salinadaptatus halalkaliphilus TaxID=2419781 RepID=A0A4S3TPR5_9EURY|nr:urease accessory protein UreE [Salinadaptatus halalkaliphilus]THE66311.1 urease accessory protein UreE [Salinadaptatus halalkaliphilus]
MERIDGIVGNVHADDELAARRDDHAAAGTLERVVLEADNRRRSRFRATTDAGTDIGVVLDRAAVSAGDVLVCEADRMIVVAFEPLEALAVTLPEATDDALEAAVELGHRIGNQHWDLAVEDGVVYVPLEADRHIVERVVANVVANSTVSETTVDADLFVTDLEDEPGYDGSHADHEHGHDDHDHGHTHADHSHDHDH